MPETPTAPTETTSPLLRMARSAWTDAEGQGRTLLLGAAACLALLVATFWSTLRYLVYVWSTDENYSHGFLVPLISLYFANEAARRGPVAVRSGVPLGIGLLTVSLLGRLATTVVPIGFVADGALLLGLAGVCALLFGADALRRYGFSLFFLVFMLPLPVALYSRIASPLQLLVSQAASSVLNAVGIPVLCEGNLMTLPGDVRMFVAEACSGMRQLTGFLALTTAVAYLTPRPFWYRAIVVVSSIPIAMLANVVRVTVTGVIMYRLEPRYAEGTYHTVEGLLLMLLGLALLAAECSLLNWLRIQGSPFRVQSDPPEAAGRQTEAVGMPLPANQ